MQYQEEATKRCSDLEAEVQELGQLQPCMSRCSMDMLTDENEALLQQEPRVVAGQVLPELCLHEGQACASKPEARIQQLEMELRAKVKEAEELVQSKVNLEALVQKLLCANAQSSQLSIDILGNVAAVDQEIATGNQHDAELAENRNLKAKLEALEGKYWQQQEDVTAAHDVLVGENEDLRAKLALDDNYSGKGDHSITRKLEALEGRRRSQQHMMLLAGRKRGSQFGQAGAEEEITASHDVLVAENEELKAKLG